MKQQSNREESETGQGHRFKWRRGLLEGEYEGPAAARDSGSKTIIFIVAGIVVVSAVSAVIVLKPFQGGAQDANAGTGPTPSKSAVVHGGDAGQKGGASSPVQPAQDQSSSDRSEPSSSPSASPVYTVERTGDLRLNRPETPLYVDFDARSWARAISDDAFTVMSEGDKTKFDLSYMNSDEGALSVMNERQFGILKPGVDATADSCLDATGSAPWTSSFMNHYGNAKEEGLVEGATLCSVTEEGRVVAAKVVKVYTPDNYAPYIDLSVRVWKPAAV
ncbi:hypothetical protein ACWCV9_09960 [Streptomyces sp. NPDC001606]